MKDDNSNNKFIRLQHILKLTEISKREWYKGVNSGKYPCPIKVGEYPMYKCDDLLPLLDMLGILATQNEIVNPDKNVLAYISVKKNGSYTE